MLELTVEDAGIRIDARIDRRPSEERAFVQLTLRIGDAAFGDPDAWALGETVARAVGDLIGDLGEQADGIAPPSGDFLRRIEPASLHAALHDWGWGSGEWRYEEDCPLGDLRPDCLLALPEGTEIFDGDSAFLVLNPGGAARLVWRERGSSAIRERAIDGDLYLRQWREMGTLLNRGLSQV